MLSGEIGVIESTVDRDPGTDGVRNAMNINARHSGKRDTSTVVQPTEETLEQLMHGYQESEGGATSELVDRLTPQLQRFFGRLHQTASDADDLLQEFWLRVHRFRHTYRRGSPLLPWIYAIARNTRVDGYRRAMRHPAIAVTEMEQFQDRRSGSSGYEAKLDIQRLLAVLPDSQREVVLLKLSGMTIQEVAAFTGVSVGSVKQKAHRAYERMRMIDQRGYRNNAWTVGRTGRRGRRSP